jgi:hypothetical protein
MPQIDPSYAVVDRAGTLLHQQNVLGAERLDVGRYLVTFQEPTLVQVVSLADPAPATLTAAAYPAPPGTGGPNDVVVSVQQEGGMVNEEAPHVDATFQLMACDNATSVPVFASISGDGLGQYFLTPTVPTTVQIVSLAEEGTIGNTAAGATITAYGGYPNLGPLDIFVGIVSRSGPNTGPIDLAFNLMAW